MDLTRRVFPRKERGRVEELEKMSAVEEIYKEGAICKIPPGRWVDAQQGADPAKARWAGGGYGETAYEAERTFSATSMLTAARLTLVKTRAANSKVLQTDDKPVKFLGGEIWRERGGFVFGVRGQSEGRSGGCQSHPRRGCGSWGWAASNRAC